jgi:putative ABC transport system permease protein
MRMMTKLLPGTLLHLGWRHLLRRPWQSVLMIVGIALGVAVVVAIDLANASASRAFELSTEAVTGRATHQIVGGPGGLEEAVYTRLRRRGIVEAAAPVVTQYVTSPQLGNRPLQLLGVDPFAEPPFRRYLAAEGEVPLVDLTAFLTRRGAVLISTDVARRYGLAPGARITLEVAGRRRPAFIAGLLQPADGFSRRALEGLILADIATAQELTGRLGRLDRIDLILPEEDPALAERIQALLPPSARLLPVEARTGTVAEMIAAFRTNLTALSLLALVVGMFLIYNTMTFSVVQRRPLFGTLRCLGVTRREVFALVVGEALVIGSVGVAFGLVLGVVLGQGAVRMVTRTINDLYFVVTVRGVAIPVASLVKGALLGLLATVVAAALPAWEAASVPPRAALSRSGLEAKARRAVGWAAIAGLVLLGAGAGVLVLPTRNLGVSFTGTFAVIVGCALLVPVGTALFMRAAAPLMSRLWGSLGRMAPRGVANALSRTSIAVAALMVAVSVTIGIRLMVGSFRYTVITWLAQSLQGDVYVSAPGFAGMQEDATLDPRVVRVAQEWPEVARVDLLRSAVVDSPVGPVHVVAVLNPTLGTERLFRWADRPPEAIWEALLEGAVLVSEPFANRVALPRRGATVTLYTDAGTHTFPVVGVYHDYITSQGTVMMALPVYRRWWRDDAITGLSLRLIPGADVDRVAHDLEEALVPVQRVLVQPNRALRQEALVVFDRTFAITGALQLLATLVAFVGVLSALLSLQLEKQREFGVLRAVGLTVRQLWGLIMLETGLMGAVAGLLAMPTGFVLSLILIYIINRRAFGWTLLMQVEAAPFLQALAVAVVAALLAGLYPAHRIGRLATVEALREE